MLLDALLPAQIFVRIFPRPAHYLDATMKITVAAVALVCALAVVPDARAGDAAYRVQYAGGTVAELAPRAGAHLNLGNPDNLLFDCRGQSVTIPYRNVQSLEYGQNVSRRYAAAVLISPMFLLTKSRRHFVTIGFTNPDGKEQVLIVRVEKGDIRSVLTTLESRTGRRIEYQDEEARRTGR